MKTFLKFFTLMFIICIILVLNACDLTNQIPVAVDDEIEMNEDEDVDIAVLENDVDKNGDLLSITTFTTPSHGTVTQDENELHYSPNKNYHGEDSFTYTVEDNKGGSATATVTITINPVNDAPVAVDDTETLDEDDDVLIEVLENDTDVDLDEINITAFTQGSNGTVTQEENKLRYTPNIDFHGTDSFTYTISDGTETSTATVTITTNSIDDAPNAEGDTATLDEDASILIDVLENDYDTDHDTLSITEFTQATNGIITQEDNELRYTPNQDYNGTDSFTYTISDGTNTSTATVTITVNPVNDAPVAVNDTASLDEDNTTLIDVCDNDTDVDQDTLSITTFTQGSNGTVTEEEGKLRYAPDVDFSGEDSFTYTISDGTETSTATVTITTNSINDAPIAVDDTATLDEDTTILIDVLSNDTDIENDVLTISEFTQGINGTVTQENNQIRYTPNVDYNGSDTFTYTISDGITTKTATVTITINPIDDAPIAVQDSVSLDEDDTILIDVLDNDYDVDLDTLSIVSFTQASNGTVIEENNQLRYTPNNNFNGTDSFTYTISDGNETSTVTVTITVNNVNDGPNAIDDTATLDEETFVLIDVLLNDGDTDNETINITTFTQGTNGTVVKVNNQLKYTPNSDFFGSDSFTYTISDGTETSTATVTVTVNNVNDDPIAFDDAVTIDEDHDILIDVLANDVDIDNDELSIINFSQPGNGFVTQENNKLRYIPNDNFDQTDTFIYTISDGTSTVIALVTITINPINDAPTLLDDNVTVLEDGSILIPVLNNDVDYEDDVLTIQDFTQGLNGTVTQEGNELRYTPDSNFNGTDSFTYTVSDSTTTSSATVNITVTPVNDAPVAVDDSITIDEDTSILIDVLANDYDIDGDSLLIGYTPILNASILIQDNCLYFTPNENYTGLVSITYSIYDGNSSASATVHVTINAVNDNPIVNDDIIILNEEDTTLIDVLSDDYDVENDILTISAFTQGTYGTVTQEAGKLRYTPNANYNGTDSFTYTVSDGNGGFSTATVSITVKPVNDSPQVNDDNITVDEDGTILTDVLVNDIDIDGDTLSISSFGQGLNGLVVQEGNSLRYTPDNNFYGTDSFTYTISDGMGGTSSGTVNVTVNPKSDTPQAFDDTGVVDEDKTVLIDVLLNDIDVDGDTVSLNGFTEALNGTVTQEGDSLRYEPNDNFYGSDSFTYEISDGNGGIATATVNITINPINDLPIATNDNVVVDEDATVLIEVLINDTDIDGDTLSISQFTQGLNGTVVQEGDSIRYTPKNNFHGTDCFTYEIGDGNGGITTATVNITIDPVNDLPIATSDNGVVNEDQTILIDVLVNDTDIDGDTLGITGFTHGLNGTVVKEGDSLRYTPNDNFNGTDSFTYEISDDNGGVVTATVNIIVNPINDLPVAVDDIGITDEEGTILIDIFVNDTDIDGDTLSISGFTQGLNGNVSQEGDSLRYTPDTNFNGIDSFIYEIHDGNGGIATATVNITINPINDLPIATSDNGVVDEDQTILIDVLVNDTDIDGDTLSISGFTQGLNGTVAQEGDSLRYTPNDNFHGTDNFTYEISDNNGGVVTATVNIIVNPINDLPVAVDDIGITDEDGTILIDVLINDTDIDGDTLFISGFSYGINGTVSQEGDSLRYTPDANFNGTDSFTYDISDGRGGIATATVNIIINPINDLPVATNDNVDIDEDSTVLIDVLTNDSDIDGDTIIITGFTQGTSGNVSLEGNSICYTPYNNFYGTDTFNYEISDGKGGIATATVVISVHGLNDDPVAVDDYVSGDEDTTLIIDVLYNDYDIEPFDTINLLNYTNGVYGTVTIVGDTIQYVPDPNFNGTDSFTYDISDGRGGNATATVYVTINPVNDAPDAQEDTENMSANQTTLIDVLDNDSDIDNDALSIHSFTQGTHGTVSQEGNELRYTPDENYSGTDSFTYEVSDGNGGITQTTVTINIWV